MKCPRCGAAVTTIPDPGGYLYCPSCSARLKTRPANPAAAAAPPPPPPPPKTPVAPSEPAVTVPAPAREAPSMEAVLAEVQVVRRLQEEILGLLRSGSSTAAARPVSAPPSDAFDGDFAFGAGDESPEPGPTPAPSPRRGRRKSVLVIDDEDATREAAVAALTQADVPVRAVSEGSAAVSAIAEERPDVIALELGIGGGMGGKDVVNVIKSTMEWVDIPIVLYTREPVTSQKEARQIHGADEMVAKGPGSAAALVSKVIMLFRRG